MCFETRGQRPQVVLRYFEPLGALKICRKRFDRRLSNERGRFPRASRYSRRPKPDTPRQKLRDMQAFPFYFFWRLREYGFGYVETLFDKKAAWSREPRQILSF